MNLLFQKLLSIYTFQLRKVQISHQKFDLLQNLFISESCYKQYFGIIKYKNYLSVIENFSSRKSLQKYLQQNSELNLFFMNLQEAQFTFLQVPQELHKAISLCVQQLLKDTSEMKQMQTKFQMKNKPTINISSYLGRMFKYMNASPLVFVYALILIDRIQECNQDFFMTQRNVHRLMITAVVIATKYFDDFYFKNSFYARLGGITTQLLNQMETQFLNLLNFNCYIDDRTVKSYLQRLQFFAQLNIQNQK